MYMPKEKNKKKTLAARGMISLNCPFFCNGKINPLTET